MGILTADDGLVDAALSELLAAPLEQRLQRDPARDVPYLLAQHHLAQVRPRPSDPPPHAADASRRTRPSMFLSSCSVFTYSYFPWPV